MILQENHKEFTIKCFAAYMKPSEVVKAFMQEFKNDLPITTTEHHAYKILRRVYRNLFNESRDAFLKGKRDDNMTDIGLTHDDNIQQELETIFGHVKYLIFSEKEPKEVIKHVNTAHALLKTIWSYNKLERKDTSK